MKYFTTTLFAIAFGASLGVGSADASPTMIRLGYADCASCHLSPQGAGLLTTYGKGVDEAQSLRAREIPPSDAPPRRFMFDVRFVAAPQLTQMLSQSSEVKTSPISAMLRSAINLNKQHRVSYTMGLEGTLLARPASTGTSAKVVVPRAMYEYRPKEGVELAVGRDVLPTGIGLPDPQTFMRNGVDSRDSRYPTQVKAFLWNQRFQVTPYVFGPGGDEVRAARQYGGGVVGGVDVWKHRAVVGMSTRYSSNDDGIDRRSVGAYARLGFGKWGILAEHDLTSRGAIADVGASADTRHLAGHTQVFFAPKEWLVTSLAAEHLVINGLTNPVHTYRLTPGVQTRLSDSLTLNFNMRDIFVDASTARSRTFTVQVAVKSIQ